MRPKQLLLVGACAIAFGCTRKQPAPAEATSAPKPVVIVVKPEKRTIQRVIELPGTLQAFEESTLYAKIPGYIGSLAVDPAKADWPEHDRLIDLGSRVKKDQLLAELTVPELDEDFKQKEALVWQAEAEVSQYKKAIAASSAGVASAKAMVVEVKAGLPRTQAVYDRWKSEVEKVAKLVGGGVVDNQTRDETQFQYKSADAGRNELLAKVSSAEAAVAKAEADLEKSKAEVATAVARLVVTRADVRRSDAIREYTRVKAPFDGVVTRRAATRGDLVAGDGKHALFAVARIDPLRMVFHVPEADAGLVTVGQEVQATLQAVQGPVSAGKIVRTSWSLEPGSRTLRAEVDLPNKEEKLRPGMYVHAKLTAQLSAEWSVPSAAVGKANDEAVMYLVEGGKAIRVFVQLVKGDAQFTQVRRYKRAGATVWTDVTGDEAVATPCAAVQEGHSI